MYQTIYPSGSVQKVWVLAHLSSRGLQSIKKVEVNRGNRPQTRKGKGVRKYALLYSFRLTCENLTPRGVSKLGNYIDSYSKTTVFNYKIIKNLRVAYTPIRDIRDSPILTWSQCSQSSGTELKELSSGTQFRNWVPMELLNFWNWNWNFWNFLSQFGIGTGTELFVKIKFQIGTLFRQNFLYFDKFLAKFSQNFKIFTIFWPDFSKN